MHECQDRSSEPMSRERQKAGRGIVKRRAYNQMNLGREDVIVKRFYGSERFVVCRFLGIRIVNNAWKLSNRIRFEL